MKTYFPLQPGHTYHIYNRGNNREDLFREERNYRYFLKLFSRYVHPVVDTYAYCLLKNHFHLLIRVKEISPKTGQEMAPPEVSQYFSNFFNAYTKSINKAYNRTGSLFEERFERIEVDSDLQFLNLVFYIHFNPQKHGFVDDFKEWPWSSYQALTCTASTKLAREELVGRFGGVDEFIEFHRGLVDERWINLTGLIDL
jgi:putative transposase